MKFQWVLQQISPKKSLDGEIVLASLDEVSGIIDVDEVSSCSDLLKSYTHTWIEQKGLRCMSIFF